MEVNAPEPGSNHPFMTKEENAVTSAGMKCYHDAVQQAMRCRKFVVVAMRAEHVALQNLEKRGPGGEQRRPVPAIPREPPRRAP